MQSTIEVHKKWNIECFSIALVAADNEGGTRLAFRYPDPSVVFQGRILPKEKFLPQLFTPKNLLHNQIVEMVIGRTSRFISYCVSEKDWNTGIAAFNVVLEVAELSTTGASSEDGTHRQQSMDFLKRILVDIAASLNFEENRQKFVSQEVKYMLKVHDQVVLESNRKTGRCVLFDLRCSLTPDKRLVFRSSKCILDSVAEKQETPGLPVTAGRHLGTQHVGSFRTLRVLLCLRVQ